MSLRKIILIVMLLTVGAGALGALTASAAGIYPATLVPLLGVTVTIAMGMALQLPLTLLVERPRFRAAGLVGMGVLLVCTLCVGAMILLDSRIFGYAGYDAEGVVMLLLAVTLGVGIPTMGGLLALHTRWGRLAAKTLAWTGLASFTLGIAAAAVSRMGLSWYSRVPLYLNGSAFTTYALGLVAACLLVNARCGDRRHFRYPAVALTAAAWVLSLVLIWLWDAPERAYGVLALMIAVAVFFACLNLLLMAKLRKSQEWARLVTMACAGAGAVVIPILLLLKHGLGEAMLGVLVLGVLTVCGGVAISVLGFMNRRADEAEAAAAAAAVAVKSLRLTCPRCETTQRVGVGDSSCATCGMEFAIRAIEPRCTACGYLLYGPRQGVCPECGAELGVGAMAGKVEGEVRVEVGS
jgi:hypothetical protein